PADASAQPTPAPALAISPLESIPAPAPHEVARVYLTARLHARLVAERHVALCGLAGSGKTTLAAALAREYAEATPVFWLTLTTGITASIAVLVRQLAHFLLAHGQEAARPLLRPTRLDDETLALDQQLRLLCAGLTRLAQRYAGRRALPPLLCLDNVHLAQGDAAMMHALRHLATTSTARVLLTSRERLHALPDWAQVPLMGMEPAEGRELIEKLSGHADGAVQSRAWAGRLLDKTGGNPMFVQLAVGQMLDERAEPSAFIAQLESQPQIAGYLLDAVERHTSPHARNILALLSVFRQPVDLTDPLLAQLLEASDGASDLAVPLAELTQRHLIHYPGRAQLHPLLRDYVYATLRTQLPRRQQLHRLAAEWAELGLDNPLEASYHYCQSGDLTDATATLVDHVDAISNGGQAFVVADLAGEIVARARRRRGEYGTVMRQLLTLRGDLLIHTLRAEEAEASYREALALAAGSDAWAQIACRLAHSLTQRGQASEAVALCQQALARCAPSAIVLRAQLSAAE
ncbi:MAG: AAA family ATPase, partial [Chloroflexales bacterium]|nr:AAA family ATPase [Chloroflexales bacterium]